MKRDYFNIAFLSLIFASVQVSVMSDPCDSCGANANCENETCVCQENYTGNPQFHCYDVNNLYCQLLNDPVLTTFGKAKLQVHVLGATRFAQFVTRRSDNVTLCNFTLFAIMERVRGKIYPSSFQFELKFSTATFQLRLKSNRQANGTILWQHFISEQGPTALSSYAAIPFNNCTIELNVTTSGFVLIEIGCCGIRFGIRPYTANSLFAPGLFVEIDTNNQPTFNNWIALNEPLCLDQGSFTFANVQTALSIPDPVKAMTYHANINTAGWAYLFNIIREYNFANSLRACKLSRRARFSDFAWFTFTNAAFINCISQNTVDNNELYNFIFILLSYVCDGTFFACKLSQSTIKEVCNTARIPYLQGYVKATCKEVA